MGQKLAYTLILIDGELHISGDICWCGSHYDAGSDTFLHQLQIDKGKTHDTSKAIQ